MLLPLPSGTGVGGLDVGTSILTIVYSLYTPFETVANIHWSRSDGKEPFGTFVAWAVGHTI